MRLTFLIRQSDAPYCAVKSISTYPPNELKRHDIWDIVQSLARFSFPLYVGTSIVPLEQIAYKIKKYFKYSFSNTELCCVARINRCSSKRHLSRCTSSYNIISNLNYVEKMEFVFFQHLVEKFCDYFQEVARNPGHQQKHQN